MEKRTFSAPPVADVHSNWQISDCSSDEAIRQSPGYFSYYQQNKHLNPRLPPPIYKDGYDRSPSSNIYPFGDVKNGLSSIFEDNGFGSSGGLEGHFRDNSMQTVLGFSSESERHAMESGLIGSLGLMGAVADNISQSRSGSRIHQSQGNHTSSLSSSIAGTANNGFDNSGISGVTSSMNQMSLSPNLFSHSGNLNGSSSTVPFLSNTSQLGVSMQDVIGILDIPQNPQSLRDQVSDSNYIFGSGHTSMNSSSALPSFRSMTEDPLISFDPIFGTLTSTKSSSSFHSHPYNSQGQRKPPSTMGMSSVSPVSDGLNSGHGSHSLSRHSSPLPSSSVTPPPMLSKEETSSMNNVAPFPYSHSAAPQLTHSLSPPLHSSFAPSPLYRVHPGQTGNRPQYFSGNYLSSTPPRPASAPVPPLPGTYYSQNPQGMAYNAPYGGGMPQSGLGPHNMIPRGYSSGPQPYYAPGMAQNVHGSTQMMHAQGQGFGGGSRRFGGPIGPYPPAQSQVLAQGPSMSRSGSGSASRSRRGLASNLHGAPFAQPSHGRSSPMGSQGSTSAGYGHSHNQNHSGGSVRRTARSNQPPSLRSLIQEMSDADWAVSARSPLLEDMRKGVYAPSGIPEMFSQLLLFVQDPLGARWLLGQLSVFEAPLVPQSGPHVSNAFGLVPASPPGSHSNPNSNAPTATNTPSRSPTSSPPPLEAAVRPTMDLFELGQSVTEADVAQCTDLPSVLLLELTPSLLSLAIDPHASPVLQRLLELAQPPVRSRACAQMHEQVLNLTLHPIGCRLVQRAIEALSQEGKVAVARELEGHVLKCVQNQHGNHVIQQIITHIHGSGLDFLLAAFRDNVYRIATHSFGCRIIQRVLEHCSSKQTAPVLQEVLARACDLLRDSFGNYVIQHIMSHGRPEQRSEIMGHVKDHVLELSQHKFASNVVERCLEFGSSSEKKAIVDEILTPTVEIWNANEANRAANANGNSPEVLDGIDESPLQVLIRDPFGNYVAQRILDVADDAQRVQIVQVLSSYAMTLKRYPYGKHILSRLEKIISARNLLNSSPIDDVPTVEPTHRSTESLDDLSCSQACSTIERGTPLAFDAGNDFNASSVDTTGCHLSDASLTPNVDASA